MGNNVQKFYVAGNLKGDPFRYEDFTPEQLEALKVKGDPFTYKDFTEEQLESLKGEPGNDGKTAYEYAVEKGYEGSEEEFAEKLASDTPVIVPESAVYQVTYTGAAYDPTTFQAEAELHTGDVLIATNESNVKTGYTYDETNGWIAMDGNVYADNVLLKENITLAGNYTQVGNITKSQNGTGTFTTAGKSVATALTEIFSKRLQPSITSNPAVSITLTGAGTYEVGTTVTPRYSASLSAGSYTYGPATGITATSWSISDTNGNTATTNSGSFSEFVVQDSTNYTVTATATHDQGAIAKDNLGSDSSPIVRIAFGNKSKTSSAIKGFRKMFWGSSTTVQNADSATIRTNSSKAVATGTLNVTVVEGAKYVMIALPAARKISKVEDTGAFGTDIFGSFTLTENVMVEGLNGYTAAAYNIYEYKPSTALGSNTYKVTVI